MTLFHDMWLRKVLRWVAFHIFYEYDTRRIEDKEDLVVFIYKFNLLLTIERNLNVKEKVLRFVRLQFLKI